jgi:ParB-like chromosome segregation protein Spo0J
MKNKLATAYTNEITQVSPEPAVQVRPVQSSDITVLPELRDLLPALNADERSALVESIKSRGVISPLDIWRRDDGSMVLVDGHNRYEITRELGLPRPKLNPVAFKDIEEVKDWIIANQGARRNFTDFQRKYFIGLQYDRAKGKQGRGINAAEAVAESNNLGARTINRYHRIFKSLQKVDEALRMAILSEKVNIDDKQLQLLEGAPAGKVYSSIDQIKALAPKKKEAPKPHAFLFLVKNITKKGNKVSIDEFLKQAEEYYTQNTAN